MPSSPAPRAIQATFDDLGTALHDVTFVVVDLETTGGSAQTDEITEIGAVKVRAGEQLGEFQTLVNPGLPIPAFISVLTGITDRMVASAPRIDTVLPAFLEFARDAVLVAHNAPFDVTFLRTNAQRLGLPWPGHQVVDTAHLARQLVTRDEAPNHKLSSLARLFGAATTPDHRALHDARATVDVLHALLGRVGNLGVHTLEELGSYSARVTTAQRRKRFLADGLPSAPGVYVFKDAEQRPLYVGTSVDIRRRVRTYFTSSEQRTRMAEMVGIAESVTPIVCATALEAQVRELRLIAEHKPRYNRRSRHPERSVWVKLTVEPFPRLSIVKEVRGDGAHYVGPFSGRQQAEQAVAAVHEVVPLRQCTQRLSPTKRVSACALAEMGRCGAPCTGGQTVEEYDAVVLRASAALCGDAEPFVRSLEGRMAHLAEQERYEDAGALRDRLLALVRGAARAQHLAPLAASPEIVAARRAESGGWEMVCVRYGRLAGSALSPRGTDPMATVESLAVSAEVVAAPTGPAPAALPEETEKILRWLETPGVRLVHLEGAWTCPVNGAGRSRDRLEPLVRAREQVSGFDEPHGRLLSRPPKAVRSGV
ncbi:DEDD exonuclease domain-containing protein [Luteipulveratus sp. YIM 133132]|uniref:DEDD exonuclease domain-containing protein n=1 Tax=Luteipulveratus flavus TaxID=3031728 RepID=UPI0023B112E5|nr:DEDD exonuclease domain-containing protein [Luteipulveratus sp. YIM 133132]MDE9366751.1 DEDD exonuclease domain-containing protein [Luteipulveratus sp. YIM 133132]